jgi:hypothetical protein
MNWAMVSAVGSGRDGMGARVPEGGRLSTERAEEAGCRSETLPLASLAKWADMLSGEAIGMVIA